MNIFGVPTTVKHAMRSLLPQSVLNWRERNYFSAYGEPEMHLVEFLCRRNEDAIDVGANYGGYVHFMRAHATRVFAFEPVPELAQLLQLKFRADVVVEQVALSDRSGDSQLSTPIVDGVAVNGCATLSTDARLTSTYAIHQDKEVRSDRLDNVYGGVVASSRSMWKATNRLCSTVPFRQSAVASLVSWWKLRSIFHRAVWTARGNSFRGLIIAGTTFTAVASKALSSSQSLTCRSCRIGER